MGSLKRFNQEKLPDKVCFYSSVKHNDYPLAPEKQNNFL